MDIFSGILEGLASGEAFSNPELLLSLITFPVAIIAAAVLILLAIYGYRLFKTTISVVVCIVCGIAGSFIAPFILEAASVPTVIEGVSLSAVIGIVFAGIGLLLGFKLYKISLFISCTAGAYLIYSPIITLLPVVFPDLPISQLPIINTPEGIMITSAVLAILTGILLLLLFKPLYIIITSVGGVAVATALIAISVAPTYEMTVWVGLILGAILGIPAAKHQFKCDEK